MRLLVFLLLLGCTCGEYTFNNSTNDITSKTCFTFPTSLSTPVVHSPFHRAANSTGLFLIYPTSPPFRLHIPIWENKTSSSCNHSSTLVPSLSSPVWQTSTGPSATQNISSPTAPPEFHSAGWSLRHRDSSRMIRQSLSPLLVILLSITS
jgi:hypothetical protein